MSIKWLLMFPLFPLFFLKNLRLFDPLIFLIFRKVGIMTRNVLQQF